MIDETKVARAASIISKLPADEPGAVHSAMYAGVGSVEMEWPDHEVVVNVNSLQPEPYMELVKAGRLLQYFVEQSLYYDHKYAEVKEAFRIVFQNMLEDNLKLQERIAELEKES